MERVRWQPALELLMVGGFSLGLSLLYVFFPNFIRPPVYFVLFLPAFEVCVNGPHLLSTYQLFYGDCRRKILTDARYFAAGILAPALLAIVLAMALWRGHDREFSLIYLAFLLIAGWHNMRQTFGTLMLTTASRNYHYGPRERRLIHANFFAVWLAPTLWAVARLGKITEPPFSTVHLMLHVPAFLVRSAFYVEGATFVLLAGVIALKVFRTRRAPPLVSLVVFAAFYFWFLPRDTYFVQLAFTFHSVQYLYCVSLWRNRKAGAVPGGRWRPALTLAAFWAACIAASYVVLRLLPRWAEAHGARVEGALTLGLILAALITIHHVAIDTVIWRRDNEFNPLNAR